MEQSSLTHLSRPDRLSKTCQVWLTVGPELLCTIDAVGIQNVPYIDYTTLWVEKQQAAADNFCRRGDLLGRFYGRQLSFQPSSPIYPLDASWVLCYTSNASTH
jgi:hypothetical protein